MTRAEEVWRVVIELSSTGRDLMNQRRFRTHTTARTVTPPPFSLSYLSYLVDTHPLPAQVSTGLALSLFPRNVLLAPLARTSPRIYLPRALIFHHVIMSLFPTTSVSRLDEPSCCTPASDKNGRESGFAPKSDYKHAGPRSMNGAVALDLWGAMGRSMDRSIISHLLDT